VLLVGKPVETMSVRVLLVQMLAHTLIFAFHNAGNFAERALLARDTAGAAALGLGGATFCLLSAFTTNVVGVCQFVVARRAGDGDEGGARAAASQALLLAGGGGTLGLAMAAVAGAVAVCAAGPARGAALFLTTQALALGPLLGACALTGYFAGTMRIGPRLVAAVSALPVAVHLALVWLLTGVLSWSVVGAGLARLGAALAAVAATLAVARAEFGHLLGPFTRAAVPEQPRCLGGRTDRSLLRRMLNEGGMLGLQQVVAGLMVLVLYLRAAGAGDITAAALSLTHAGVYPLLFAFAWGSSQAVGAAAAQAVGRGDARELARVTRLGLGFSAALAFALPWGAYAAFGGPTLAWLVEGSPAGAAVLAASASFMGWLAVFFVFDFAINFLSALLKAAKEQVYLLKATVAAAAGFVLLVALPLPAGDAWLMGTFIAAQAAWAVLLLGRVVSRWPGAPVFLALGAFRPQTPGRPTAPPFRIDRPGNDSHSGATCDGTPFPDEHRPAAPGAASPCPGCAG
jgi:Na+-driven multidrug efflux pump